MHPKEVRRLLIIAIIVMVMAAVAWAASPQTVVVNGLPVMAWCAGLALGVQVVAFVPAYFKQTEHFYDLTGSLTHISVTLLALLATGRFDPRALLLTGLIVVWAGRLGLFLFMRINADGKDGRFDKIKPDAVRFLITWMLQGLWVFLTLCAALTAITVQRAPDLGVLDVVGLVLWIIGFSIEVMADQQKRSFRARNPGRFIDTGLWAWSRHPNYFGEILLWIGIAVMATSTLEGSRYVVWISPVFVTLLLTRVSGIPLLEKRADSRWGDDAGYRAYKERTPVLIPRPPGGNR